MAASISRRELLKWASAGAGAAAVGSATYMFGRNDPPSQVPASLGTSANGTVGRQQAPDITTGATDAAPVESVAPATSPVMAAADPGQRLLVVVEMGGGNDGMSMLVPYGMGRYYDLRPSTAVAESDVLGLDDEFGFHPSLPKLHARGAAVLQGVGAYQPDGSHFEMQARWWNGSQYAGNAYDTGFLGRMADAIGDPAAAAVALSVGTGSNPALISRVASTLSIPDAYAAGYVVGANDDDRFRQLFQRGFSGFGSAGSDAEVEARLRYVMAQTEAFAWTLGALEDEEEDAYPDSQLGKGLKLTAQLFSGDSGVRIVHVPMQAGFDTHDDHNGQYPYLMQDFDDSLQAFMDDLAARGLSERVLVMTTSEFGRTARDNGSGGLDHGTASNVVLMGPVANGRHGEHPSLDDLDDNDNLKATVGFDQYYATIAEHWFGVPASDVLDADVRPIDGIITA
jgi:uncharacterized protein (DUF1501 family)